MKELSQKGKQFIFDTIVIGSGIAGLSYILELVRLQPKIKIALITKTTISESNSRYAQGGIATVASPDDSYELHTKDTLSAGDDFCHQPAVEAIIKAGPKGIQHLIQHGVGFDKNEDGNNDLNLEGGHSKRRIHHAKDITGAEIIRALTIAIQQLRQVSIFEYHTAVNLIAEKTLHQPGKKPGIIGAYILDEKHALVHTFLGKTVVLATGGAGKVYRYTSNPDLATGDGIAMAYRAGARVGNMEFYQFHPTLFYHPQTRNFLLSEALRGEGAYLRLPNTGERFMQRYAPEKMELATRDIVSRAIFTEIEYSANHYVYLDVRHFDKSALQQRFPNIYQTLLKHGIDMKQDLIPVVPAAHYLCGGILTDVNGQTDLERLFAIGETAFTGLHGANRLASNSLLEGVVMGCNAAHASLSWLTKQAPEFNNTSAWDSGTVVDKRRASQINAHWRGLRGEMTSYAGIIRTQAGLEDVLRLTHTRREIIESYYWKHAITRDLIELRNIALVAELIIKAALKRQESRGVHFRADYPDKNTATQTHYKQNKALLNT